MVISDAERSAVSGVLHDYVRGVDDRDWGRVMSCYHPDAVDNHGVYQGDPAGLVAHFQEHIDAYAGTLHLLSGSDLVRLDDEVIGASTLCLALHWVAAGSDGKHLVMVADYDDRFTLRESWRIEERTVRVRMAEEFASSAEPWALIDRFATAQR